METFFICVFIAGMLIITLRGLSQLSQAEPRRQNQSPDESMNNQFWLADPPRVLQPGGPRTLCAGKLPRQPKEGRRIRIGVEKMTPDDFIVLMRVLNFGTALLAAVIIAWTRHGEPANEQSVTPSRFIQFVYKMDADFISVRERMDPLTDDEKQIIRQMVEQGTPLTFRQAAGYGIKRAAWNRVRSELVNMGTADIGQAGEMILTAAGTEYLNISKER